MANRKSANEIALTKFIKSLNPIEEALIRERLLHIMELTINDIANHPKTWKNGFVNPQLYIDLNSKVKEHLDFEN